jgi:hypothetical protein
MAEHSDRTPLQSAIKSQWMYLIEAQLRMWSYPLVFLGPEGWHGILIDTKYCKNEAVHSSEVIHYPWGQAPILGYLQDLRLDWLLPLAIVEMYLMRDLCGSRMLPQNTGFQIWHLERGCAWNVVVVAHNPQLQPQLQLLGTIRRGRFKYPFFSTEVSNTELSLSNWSVRSRPRDRAPSLHPGPKAPTTSPQGVDNAAKSVLKTA